MSLNICENCGHPESSHDPNRCVWCEADKVTDPSVEVCPGFKPDVFHMWDLNEEEENNESY